MTETPPCSPAQTMVDAVIDGAAMVETGRIAQLARQGLEDPLSLTGVQARQVFGAFLLLFDPDIRPRGEPFASRGPIHVDREVRQGREVAEMTTVEAGVAARIGRASRDHAAQTAESRSP